MYTDPLSQTRTYQSILKKGHEEGLQEGLEKGRLATLQFAVLYVVEVRFPSLMELAQEWVPRSSKPDILELTFKALLKFDDEKTVRWLLESWLSDC
jgi:hypothetical protein